ncbi:MAG: hypothetical protein ACO1QB_15275 [Verrucomicrobiales bacterium]
MQADTPLRQDLAETENHNYSNSFAHYAGFFALICSLVYIPLAIVAVRTYSTAPNIAGIFLLISIPVVILLIVAGIGLLKKKSYGFFVLYIIIFFGQIGGFKTPLVPFLKRFIDIGYRTPDLFLLINIAVGAFVLRDHLFYLQPSQSQRRTIFALWAAGILFVVAGQFLELKQKGTALSPGDLPVIGSQLADLKVKGPVEYQMIHQKLQNSVMQVASGSADPETIQTFAKKKGLKALPHEQAKKLMALSRNWKLDPAVYPQKFETNDLAYTGRMEAGGKMNLQLGFDRQTGRFALQAMGSLVE